MYYHNLIVMVCAYYKFLLLFSVFFSISGILCKRRNSFVKDFVSV